MSCTIGVDLAQLAPHGRRVLAFAVDAVIATLVPIILVVIGSLALPEVAVPWWLVGVVLVMAGLAGVGGLSVWLTGGLTMGKALTGLTERRIDGSPPRTDLKSLGWSLSRHSVGYVLVDVLGLGVLVSFLTPRRRCLHDVVFGSEVVYLPPRADLRSSAQERGESFSTLLQDGLKDAEERYGWMTFLLRWWVRVILAVSGLVFFVFKSSALGAGAQVTTPAVATTAAPSTVGPVAMGAIIAPASAVTISLLAIAAPDGDRAYTGLEVASTVNVEQPGPAAWDPSAHTLVVASGDDQVLVIDPDTGAIADRVAVPKFPSDVVADPGTGTIWVSSSLGDTVSVIDSGTREVIQTVPVEAPVDMAHGPADRVVYVAGRGGTVTTIEVRTRAVVDTIELPLRPGVLEYSLGRMAMDPVAGHLYVHVHSPRSADYVSLIDTAAGEEIAQIDGDLEGGLGLEAVSRSLYLSPGGNEPVLSVIDADTNKIVDALAVPADPDTHGDWFASDPPSGTLSVLSKVEKQLTVIDATTRRPIDSIAFEEQPTGVLIDTDTGDTFVAAFYDDVVYLLEPR
ncbi:MAG: RDD family protein [Dermatophilaceae bacterium]